MGIFGALQKKISHAQQINAYYRADFNSRGCRAGGGFRCISAFAGFIMGFVVLFMLRPHDSGDVLHEF